jgi:hypothetical protein
MPTLSKSAVSGRKMSYWTPWKLVNIEIQTEVVEKKGMPEANLKITVFTVTVILCYTHSFWKKCFKNKPKLLSLGAKWKQSNFGFPCCPWTQDFVFVYLIIKKPSLPKSVLATFGVRSTSTRSSTCSRHRQRKGGFRRQTTTTKTSTENGGQFITVSSTQR